MKQVGIDEPVLEHLNQSMFRCIKEWLQLAQKRFGLTTSPRSLALSRIHVRSMVDFDSAGAHGASDLQHHILHVVRRGAGQSIDNEEPE